MKPSDLLFLKAELKLRSTAELLRRLGISATAYTRWMKDNPDQELPTYFALAAAALKAGLHPYTPGDVTPADLALYGGDAARKVYGRTVDAPHEAELKADRLLSPPSAT